MEKYRLFSVQEFMNDPYFQDWVYQPDAEKHNAWNKLMQEEPALSAKIKEAKRFLEMIDFKEEFPEPERVEFALSRVQQKMLETVEDRKLVRMNVWIKRLAVAASIILAVSFGIYFLLQNKTGEPVVKTNDTKPADVIVPGGNKATLTLVDGTVIQLDSTGTGAIANQGNITIYTSNGELAYKPADGTATNEIVFNTINTPKGGQYQLVLSDGTKVWLNSASSLRYPTAFAGEKRIVELTGEGYFEVAHNAKQPFHVKVNDMEVAVLGTHFNINSYSDEPSVKTTLLEGKVMVKKKDDFVLLNPGQQAIVAPEQTKIRIAHTVDVDEVVAWKNGKFLFNGADVETIMRQVARWYDVEIVYEQKINEPISGGLGRSENVQQLLNILEATGKVKFRVNGKQIVVKAN